MGHRAFRDRGPTERKPAATLVCSMLQTDPNYKQSMLENGIDFIVRGVDGFFWPDDDPARAYKYALLNLFSGVLLILKERISRVNPSAIFVKGNKTLGFDEVIEKIESVAGVKLSPQEVNLLRKVRNLRNKIEHHQFEVDRRETDLLVGELASFVCLFLRDHLGIPLENHIDGGTWHYMQDLRAIAARVESEEYDKWSLRAESYRRMSDEELSKLAEDEPYHPKHNPDPIGVEYCEECYEMSVAIMEGDIAVCTNAECRSVSQVPRCLRCNDLIPGGRCGYCEQMTRDCD